MLASVWSVALSVMVQVAPYGYGGAEGPPYEAEPAPYAPAAAANPQSCGAFQNGCAGGPAYAGDVYGRPVYGGEDFPFAGTPGCGDELYPYDAPYPWHHGYFQEIPAYGGFNAFRPYNYKHLFAQSHIAAGWGMNPMMPYSQQFWHRHHHQAAMKKHITQMPAGGNETMTAAQPGPAPFEPAVSFGSEYEATPPPNSSVTRKDEGSEGAVAPSRQETGDVGPVGFVPSVQLDPPAGIRSHEMRLPY